MTKQIITEMGFEILSRGKLWHGATETEINIGDYKKVTTADFINKFADMMLKGGNECGRKQKMDEIKLALGVNIYN